MNSGKKTYPVVYDKSIPLPVLDDIGVNTYDTKGRWLPRFTQREKKTMLCDETGCGSDTYEVKT